MRYDLAMSTAALVVIGDEILSGKVQDSNTPYLIGELRSLGVALRQIQVVPDVLEDIAAAVAAAVARFDHVFTSGGVGPTHDDLTIAGVALALGRPVVRHPQLEAALRGYYERKGQPLVERNLRMADVPEGATLLQPDELHWPVLTHGKVYILPGVPEIFRAKFAAIRERFRVAPFHQRQVLVRDDEGVIARHLDQIAERYPSVALGSYPRFAVAPDGHRVKLTLEGKDRGEVEAAHADLVGLLGQETVVSA